MRVFFSKDLSAIQRLWEKLDAPKPVYQELFEAVKGKDYFVITTNVDHCFQKAGFDKKRLFYTQGDYGLFQCSGPCCQETFGNEEAIRKMMECQKDMRIPEELLPVCPHCGKPMTMNLRSDGRFVQDEGWYRAAEQYENFLRARKGQMTVENPKATYACINDGEAAGPKEIEHQAVYINGDIGEILAGLNQRKGGSMLAGAVEFVAVDMLLGAFAPFRALAMTLMINARHLFYGISMLDRYKGMGIRAGSCFLLRC